MNPKTYEEQRKQRLDEAVFDYIQDEKVTPRQFYEELQEVLLNNSKYFQEQAMRVDRMRQLVSEGLESPDMSRYSQYTEAEIDAMSHVGLFKDRPVFVFDTILEETCRSIKV